MEMQGNTVTASYTYGNALLSKGLESFLYDGQGTTRQVVNMAGATVSDSTSDAFGNTVAASGTKPEYGYGAQSGYRDDGDAGLVHIGARYYDPQVGLFTTRDTELDQKPYQYCDGDPVNYNDPSGHQYFHIGGSWGFPCLLGVQAGIFIENGHIHPYVGGGFMLPGWGASGGVGAGHVAPHTFSVQASLSMLYYISSSAPVTNLGSASLETGLATPGFSLTGYYTW